MNAVRKIVVVGGGPAGVAAALAAKQQDAAAEVILLSDERQEPYEKPPLSKAVLTGKAMPHDAPIAGPKGVSGSGVRLTLGTPVKAIDRSAHAVITETGERIGYDALVLATGSINRELPMFPAGRKGIYYLRTEAEARALKARRRQDGRGRNRAAHPCSRLQRGDLRVDPRASPRPRRRYPRRHRRVCAARIA